MKCFRNLGAVLIKRGLSHRGLWSRIVRPIDAASNEWIEPAEGDRRRVWRQLQACVNGQGTGLIWSLLVGPSGSGKTHMLWQLGRQLAAGWMAFRLDFRSEKAHPQHLAGWRPQGPTLLTLDNTLPAVVAVVIGVLAAEADDYRYPVHLVISGLSIPSELRLMPRDASGQPGWISALPRFSGSLLVLSGSITPRDVRLLALQADLPRMRWRDATVRRFLEATSGNPYLVRLGLAWLERGGTLETLTPAALIQHQVDTLIVALRRAGIGSPDHLRALAVANLAGLANTPVRRGPVQVAFNRPRFPAEAVRSVFPDADADRLPPMQPVMVGDAFVRTVLVRDPDFARRITACGWQVGPGATAVAAERLLPVGDTLALALGETMALEAGIDAVDVVLRLCRAAVLIPRCDWDTGEARDHAMALDRALAAIGYLPPVRAGAALGSFAALLNVANAEAVARGTAGFACFCAAVRQALHAPPAFWSRPEPVRVAADALTLLVEQVVRWGMEETQLDAGLLAAPAALIRHLGRFGAVDPWAACWDRLGRVFDDRGGALPVLAESMLTALSEAGDIERDNRHEGRVAAAIRIRLCGAALRDTPDMVAAAARILDDAGRNDRMAMLEAARAWRQVAYAYARRLNCNGCTDAVQRVSELASLFAGERGFVFELARSLKSLAFVYGRQHDSAQCLAVAESLDRAIGRFGGDRDFALLRVETWMYLAESRSRSQDIAGCMQAALTIDRMMGGRFDGDRDFELARLRAWTDMAFLYTVIHDREGCAAAVERVVGGLAAHFTGERAFESERVMALKQLAFACAQAADADGGADAAAQISRIVRAGFAGQAQFELEHAQAWSSVAYARATAHDLEGAIAAAEIVESIMITFRDDPKREIERECVNAWRSVAFASHSDPVAYQNALRHLETFAAIPEFQAILAETNQ